MKRILTKKKIKKKRKEKNIVVPYQKGSFYEISLGHILIISLIILVVLSSSHFTKQSPWSAVQLLAKRLLHRFYTHRFSFSPFLLLLRNIHNGPHKATGSLFSCRSFLCVLLLNPLFSQPNGNETHRYPVVLFSPLVLSLCFSLFCCRFRFPFSFLRFFCFFDWFLSHVYCSASAVFLIDWFHQGTNYEFS